MINLCILKMSSERGTEDFQGTDQHKRETGVLEEEKMNQLTYAPVLQLGKDRTVYVLEMTFVQERRMPYSTFDDV